MSDGPQPLTSYENGMLDERAHQDALTRLAMKKHQEEIDALKAELARLRAQLADMTNAQHVNEKSLDEYARTIARLRAELAECQQAATVLAMLTEESEWEDVPDGKYGHDMGVRLTVHGRLLEIENDTSKVAAGYNADGIVRASVMFRGNYDWKLVRRKESEATDD